MGVNCVKSAELKCISDYKHTHLHLFIIQHVIAEISTIDHEMNTSEICRMYCDEAFYYNTYIKCLQL